jgi:hypothetical protein
MKLSRAWIAIVLAILVATTSGCGVVNRIRSKNQLNEAARAYRDRRYVEAEQYSRRSAELDPNNKTAPMFIARSIHAQYRPGVQQPENLAKAQEAIQAYQQILADNPQNDEAYKAIAYLYEAINEDAKLRDWILARANSETAEPDKRAQAFIVLASQDWNCSFQITELPAHKVIDQSTNKATVVYKKPADQKDFDQAQMCVKRGLGEAENAIKFAPENESAWSYRTNLLLEASKLAEMAGQTDQKAKYQEEYQAALKRTQELSDLARKRKAEEEAKQAPSPQG